MNAFYNLKTGVKLIGGFMLVAILLIVVAAIGYVSMKSINDGMATLYYGLMVPV